MNSAASPNSGRKLFFGLFVFPLLIAVGMAVLLCAVVFLTNEDQTATSLISSIKSGSPTQRWQKAYELSNELNRSKDKPVDPGVMRGIIHILADKAQYDPKTRAYMAIALSHFRHPEAYAALRAALNDPDAEVRLYSLWALGVLKPVDAANSVIPFLKNDNENLRKTACYVLGAIGDSSAVPHLRICLNDSVSDVKWNASLALARLGDRSGLDLLIEMTQREALLAVPGMNEDAIQSVMINAVRGLALLGGEKAESTLKMISKNEKNLKVRQAAITALSHSSNAAHMAFPMENIAS